MPIKDDFVSSLRLAVPPATTLALVEIEGKGFPVTRFVRRSRSSISISSLVEKEELPRAKA
jgi:hypothetical protein